jgi:hypothetical protein
LFHGINVGAEFFFEKFYTKNRLFRPKKERYEYISHGTFEADLLGMPCVGTDHCVGTAV